MLKLLVFTTLVAFATSEGLKDFVGNWSPVKIYPEIPQQKICGTMTLDTTEETCQCGEMKNVPVIKISNNHDAASGVIRYPVTVVSKKQDAEGALNKKCTCQNKENQADYTIVYQYLNEKYFLAYNKNGPNTVTVLMAKELQSIKEINDFTQTVDDLKDLSGTVLCASDYNDATETTPTEQKTTLTKLLNLPSDAVAPSSH